MRPYLVKSPYIISKYVYPDLYWHIPTNKKEIFLTFDDGPTPNITEKVLDILSDYNAKATFFLVGDKLASNQALLQQIIAQEHSIGNHTFNHLNGWKTQLHQYLKNIDKTTQLLDTNLLRPPYGRIKRSQVNRLKSDYHIIMWSLLSGDFDMKISPEACYKNISGKVKKGDIIVFHDSEKAADRLFYALPKILDEYTRKGYTFSAITERCFEEKKEINPILKWGLRKAKVNS